jgi:hypothetical protein
MGVRGRVGYAANCRQSIFRSNQIPHDTSVAARPSQQRLQPIPSEQASSSACFHLPVPATARTSFLFFFLFFYWFFSVNFILYLSSFYLFLFSVLLSFIIFPFICFFLLSFCGYFIFPPFIFY